MIARVRACVCVGGGGQAGAARAAGDPSGDRLLTNVAAEVVGFELGRSSRGDAAATAALVGFLAALPAAGLPSLLSLCAARRACGARAARVRRACGARAARVRRACGV